MNGKFFYVALMALTFAGCHRNRALQEMSGSYVRSDAIVPIATELNVNAGGITVQGGASLSEGIDVGGKSILELGGRLGSVKPGATQFETVSCDDATCRFTSKTCPSGSLTRDASGDLVVIADGDCASWSGRWQKRTSATASATRGASPPGSDPPSAPLPPSPQIPTMPTGPTMPTMPTAAATCGNGASCPPVSCHCEDGSATSATYCFNGECLGAEACVHACADHEGVKGTWDAHDGKKNGQVCHADGECASSVCIWGYCTKSCDSFSDCPSFWSCEDPPSGQRARVGLASAKVCKRS